MKDEHLTEEQIKALLAFLAKCILDLDHKYASIYISPEPFDIDAVKNLHCIKNRDYEYIEDVREWEEE